MPSNEFLHDVPLITLNLCYIWIFQTVILHPKQGKSCDKWNKKLAAPNNILSKF